MNNTDVPPRRHDPFDLLNREDTESPEEPDCHAEGGHDWDGLPADHEYKLLGGLRENPGVFDRGSYMTTLGVCAVCGTLRERRHYRAQVGVPAHEKTTYRFMRHFGDLKRLRSLRFRITFDPLTDGVDPQDENAIHDQLSAYKFATWCAANYEGFSPRTFEMLALGPVVEIYIPRSNEVDFRLYLNEDKRVYSYKMEDA